MERRIPRGPHGTDPIPDMGAPLPCWPADDADLERVVDGPEGGEGWGFSRATDHPDWRAPGPDLIRSLSF